MTISRTTVYFFALAFLGVVPLIMLAEFKSETIWLAPKIVEAIASSANIVSTDIALLGELTPAIAAGVIAAFSPRPMNGWTGAFSILICATGYMLYLTLSIHSSGGRVFFSNSMLTWIELFIDGNTKPEDFDQAINTISDFFDGVRTFYLVAGGSILGFLMNDAKKEDKKNSKSKKKKKKSGSGERD